MCSTRAGLQDWRQVYTIEIVFIYMRKFKVKLKFHILKRLYKVIYMCKSYIKEFSIMDGKSGRIPMFLSQFLSNQYPYFLNLNRSMLWGRFAYWIWCSLRKAMHDNLPDFWKMQLVFSSAKHFNLFPNGRLWGIRHYLPRLFIWRIQVSRTWWR